MAALDIEISTDVAEAMCLNDKKRVKAAEKQASAATHEARKARKRQKTLQLEKFQEEEGTMYESGAF